MKRQRKWRGRGDEQALEKYQTAKLRAANEAADDGFLARIHFNIGVCHYHLKNSGAAVKEFDEAVKPSRGTC